MDRSGDLTGGTSVLEPLEHSVPKVPLDGGDGLIGSRTVSDPSEYSGASIDEKLLSASCPKVHSEGARDRRGGSRDHGGEDGTLQDLRKDASRVPPEAEEAIVVGAVGSAATVFLTGWAEDMEVKFMIDVFKQMRAADPQVRSRLCPYGRRLVSADSSPLPTVKGELELNVVFPGLSCDMLFVVASIGSDGLLGTEALQSCLPHQLDLRKGQLWAEGRATLQLHQERPMEVQGLLMNAVVLLPESEIVAPFSVSGGRLGPCALVEPSRSLMEEYGVVVRHTLVEASSWSASVLMINPNTEEIVLPCKTCVGKLVPIAAASVAHADPELPGDMCVVLPDHLEEIVMGSHRLLGQAGDPFMQTEVGFLGHIVGRTGLACDPAKLSAVHNWHALDKVRAMRQFMGFVGYYRRFVKDFSELAEPLVALTRKGASSVWTDRQQTAFDALKACFISAPILGFPTEDGRFLLDTDTSLFAVGGVLNQIQDDREVVSAYTSRSLRLSQRRYCTTHREMLVAVVMCMHFRSYLWGLSSPFGQITVL